MGDPVRVFVSHHHSPEEDAFTKQLVADLKAAGADVWVDDEGITSDDFVRKISEGLAGRQWLILVMTPASVQSPWVQREVNAALSEHTAGRMLGVLPVVMLPCDMQDIPILWRNLHRYDAFHDYAPARDGLIRALGLTPMPDQRRPSAPPESTPPTTWEYCEIACGLIADTVTFYFFAQVTGPAGMRSEGSRIFSAADDTLSAVTTGSKEAQQAVDLFAKDLISLGWEELDERGPHWFSHRFRRKLTS